MPENESTIRCLLLLPAEPEYRPIRVALRNAAKTVAIRIRDGRDSFTRFGPVISSDIAETHLFVADLSGLHPSFLYTLGAAEGMGKPILLLAKEGQTSAAFIPNAMHLAYSNTPAGLANLEQTFRIFLEEFKKSPESFRRSPLIQAPSPVPVVDLNKLEPREFENLCFELLSQMGFRRVDWDKELPGIDAIAELPRRDPDGFEYRELWLISMGFRAPLEVLVDMATEPEFLYRRVLGRGELGKMVAVDVPITLLCIPFRGEPPAEVIERQVQRLERRWPDRPYSVKSRIRVWDAFQLTTLVQKYPQLVYKYFSQEGRAQSKYRKTQEELNQENVRLNEQLQNVNEQLHGFIAALQEEKEKRIKAERDAIWKELSFTAAHKLGNPVFALETDLQALKTRLEHGSDEWQVAEEMGSSLEKAKVIIEQFKSLTKAQEISPRPTEIYPLIKAACRVAEERGVQVNIKIPDQQPPEVLVDADRITECFDELIANALHWLDKAEKRISIVVDMPKSKEVPETLDHSKRYVRLRFEDNGCGIHPDHKKKVFAPFFTTYPHGTGLGLSLVERIVEGHGGLIRENGNHGEGATFEMYLPAVTGAKGEEKKNA